MASSSPTLGAASLRARHAARVRNALQPGGPDRMARAREGVFRKFLGAIDTVAPGLPESEREERARRLQAAWHMAIGSAGRRGRSGPRLSLDDWLAGVVARHLTKNAAVSSGRETTAPEEMRDVTALSSKEERRVSDVRR